MRTLIITIDPRSHADINQVFEQTEYFKSIGINAIAIVGLLKGERIQFNLMPSIDENWGGSPLTLSEDKQKAILDILNG
jgi:hypothetical protein